nr:uncharacterized protein CTRU02_00264 [Colletotrichum truncatum]KAF6801515.1 hypothetical protein CTRU02_00264 [Colletotrichum truncatum]
MSGLEEIYGTLGFYDGYIKRSTNVSIFSSTLTTIRGGFQLSESSVFRNISFPRLSTVGGVFSLYLMDNLEYVDVTDLHSVGHIRIHAPQLSTFKHNELRNINGDYFNDDILISACKLESLDSIFNNNIKIRNAVVANVPSLKSVTIGFSAARKLSFDNTKVDGEPFEVIFGGKNTESMQLGDVSISGGAASVKRDPGLQKLTARTFTVESNRLKHLDVPFNELGGLYVSHENNIKWVSVPEQAKQWEDFILVLSHNPNLNLSSEYMT